MSLEHIVADVDPRWRDAFRRFVETGEAETAFLDYLDHDPVGQHAAERAFNEQAASLEGLALAIRETPPGHPETSLARRTDRASDELVEAFDVVLTLPHREREETFRSVVDRILRRRGGEAPSAMRSALRDFERLVPSKE
jgi:hypothetical protein